MFYLSLRFDGAWIAIQKLREANLHYYQCHILYSDDVMQYLFLMTSLTP
jgi:hypothetical protein